MDGVRRKRCETCVHHVAGPTPCTGICRNLIWQPKTDAVRFVRDRELACYGGWEVDYWLPKPDAFPSNGSGGPNPGSGGAPGGGASVAAYGTLFGAPRDRDAAFLWLIPIDLLAESDFGMGLDPGPRDTPGFGG